jgi:hypothetical protein
MTATSAKAMLSEVRTYFKIMAIAAEDANILSKAIDSRSISSNSTTSDTTAVKTINSAISKKDTAKQKEKFGIIHDSSNTSSKTDGTKQQRQQHQQQQQQQQQLDVASYNATADFIEATTSAILERQSKRSEKIKALATHDAQQELYNAAVLLYKNLENEEFPKIISSKSSSKTSSKSSSKKSSDTKVFAKPQYIAISTRSGIDSEILKYSAMALILGGRFAAISAALTPSRTDAVIDGIALGVLANHILITLLMTVGQTHTAIIWLMLRDILSGPIRYITQV